MKGLLVLASAIAVLAAASAASAHDKSCRALLDEVSHNGADATVRRLRNGEHDMPAWNRIMNQIEQGRPECIRLAVALRPNRSAAGSEDLDYAVSRALVNNPEAVLRTFGHGFSSSMICEDRTIEPPAEEVRAFVAAAERALKRVEAPDVRVERDACLRYLQRTPSN